jgi:hypothetical protein
VLAALTPDHPSLAAGVIHVSDTTPLPTAPFLAAPIMFVGLILAGAGLLMGGFRPVWLPVLLIVGAVVIYLFGDGEIGAVFHAPITIAIAGLGVVLARRSSVAAPTPTPAAVPETV